MMSIDREKGSKKEGEGIAELGEDKGVVEGSDANGQPLWHWQCWPHLLISI